MMKIENEDSWNDKYFRGRLSTDEDCRLQTEMNTLMKTPSTSEGEFVSAPTSADYVIHQVLKIEHIKHDTES